MTAATGQPSLWDATAARSRPRPRPVPVSCTLCAKARPATPLGLCTQCLAEAAAEHARLTPRAPEPDDPRPASVPFTELCPGADGPATTSEGATHDATGKRHDHPPTSRRGERGGDRPRARARCFAGSGFVRSNLWCSAAAAAGGVRSRHATAGGPFGRVAAGDPVPRGRLVRPRRCTIGALAYGLDPDNPERRKEIIASLVAAATEHTRLAPQAPEPDDRRPSAVPYRELCRRCGSSRHPTARCDA